MKNRLARIFDPEDSRTVMLAIDHGYFQGPTTGLERIDITIVPLIAYADALMVTQGRSAQLNPRRRSQGRWCCARAAGRASLKSCRTSWWRSTSMTPFA